VNGIVYLDAGAVDQIMEAAVISSHRDVAATGAEDAELGALHGRASESRHMLSDDGGQ
jgi:hypothetical protein